jgi:hypothetical protein
LLWVVSPVAISGSPLNRDQMSSGLDIFVALRRPADCRWAQFFSFFVFKDLIPC